MTSVPERQKEGQPTAEGIEAQKKWRQKTPELSDAEMIDIRHNA